MKYAEEIFNAHYNRTEMIFYYHLNKTKLEETTFRHDMASLDYLILTIVLLSSVGVALGRNLSLKWETDEAPAVPQSHTANISPTIVQDERPINLFFETLMAGISNSFHFVNIFCLFAVSGQVITNGVRVIYFMFGIVVSAVLVLLLGINSVLGKAKITNISDYLWQRYPESITAHYLLIGASLSKYVMIGVLHLHIAAIAMNVMTAVHCSLAVAMIAMAALVCACVGKVQRLPKSSVSRFWLTILCLATFATCSVTTISEGGLSMLISKAIPYRNSSIPSDWNSTWDGNSSLGFIILGIIFGLKMFLLSPISMKSAAKLPIAYFNIAVIITTILVLLWLCLGVWSGLCCMVTFPIEATGKRQVVIHPDGALARFILMKTTHTRGFRGFFVASLVASSISSLMIRFNQVISLVWSLYEYQSQSKSISKRFKDISYADYVLNHRTDVSEEAFKEVKWSEKSKSRDQHLNFKLLTGVASFGVITGLTFALREAAVIGAWEMWQTMVGVICGAALGSLFIGMFLPCVPQKGLVVGLCSGWVASISMAVAITVANAYKSHGIVFTNSSRSKCEVILENESDLTDVESDDLSNSFTFYLCYCGVVSLAVCIITAVVFGALTPTARYNCNNKLIHPAATKLLEICKRPLDGEANTSNPRRSTQENGFNMKIYSVLSVLHDSCGM